MENFNNIMKTLERAIHEEDTRTTNDDVDQFEHSQEKHEYENCHIEES